MGKRRCSNEKDKENGFSGSNSIDDNQNRDYWNYMPNSMSVDTLFDINYQDKPQTNFVKTTTKKNDDPKEDYKQYVYKIKNKPIQDDTNNLINYNYSNDEATDFNKSGFDVLNPKVYISDIENKKNEDIIEARIAYKSPKNTIRKHFNGSYPSHYEKVYSNWLFESFTIKSKNKVYNRENMIICRYDGCSTICLSKSSYYYHIATFHGYKSFRKRKSRVSESNNIET